MTKHDISASLSCFAFIIRNFAQILKHVRKFAIAWLQILETLSNDCFNHNKKQQFKQKNYT